MSLSRNWRVPSNTGPPPANWCDTSSLADSTDTDMRIQSTNGSLELDSIEAHARRRDCFDSPNGLTGFLDDH